MAHFAWNWGLRAGPGAAPYAAVRRERGPGAGRTPRLRTKGSIGDKSTLVQVPGAARPEGAPIHRRRRPGPAPRPPNPCAPRRISRFRSHSQGRLVSRVSPMPKSQDRVQPHEKTTTYARTKRPWSHSPAAFPSSRLSRRRRARRSSVDPDRVRVALTVFGNGVAELLQLLHKVGVRLHASNRATSGSHWWCIPRGAHGLVQPASQTRAR